MTRFGDDTLSARRVHSLPLPELYPGRWAREGECSFVLLHFVATRDGFVPTLSTLEVVWDMWGDVEQAHVIDGLSVAPGVLVDIKADISSKKPALRVADVDDLIALSRKFRGRAA